MRQQKGCISIDRDNWTLRWRENVREGDTVTRKMRFKVLGEVTAEHKRNKDRKTGKLRIPDDIQAEAQRVMEPVDSAPISVLATIGTVADEFLKHKKQIMRHASYASYSSCWKLHLRDRISRKVLRDFERKDAFALWERLAHDNPEISRKTLGNIRIFVSGLFKYALDRGLYKGDNPACASLPAGLRSRAETEAYTIDEVARLLNLVVSPMYQAVIALAWGSGMRKSELQGVRWQDYERTDNGATIHVRQSIVEGHINAPKTEASKDDVKIDSVVAEYIDAYAEICGKPTEGLMFAYSKGRALNLQSYASKTLARTLNWCTVCKENKNGYRGKRFHGTEQERKDMMAIIKKSGGDVEPWLEDHDYQPRNATLLEWKGWHAFRRGNATFLAQNGGMNSEAVRAASAQLRHSDTGVTQEHYIKNTKQERRALEAGKLLEMDATRAKAAAAIGAGLKRALQ